MSFIGTHILFLITLAFLQTNGCFNEETIEFFYNIDLDGNGFVTYEEFCQAGIQSEDKEECDELWNSFDWNKDDKITCQGRQLCILNALILKPTKSLQKP